MAHGQIASREEILIQSVAQKETDTTVNPSAQSTHTLAAAVAQNPQAVEAKVRAYFADIPIMAEIARCESTFRHRLADGSVLRGYVDSADTGVMQINLRYHAATAERLGLDLEDIYDNMAYARNLYERKGTQPWNASAPCWGHHHLAANY